MRSFTLCKNGLRLRGTVLRPKHAASPLPVAVLSHGFGSNMLLTRRFAGPFLNAGYAVVLYDFCGSGSGISDGKSTEMTLSSEAENLRSVLDYARHLPFADPERITLGGCSQGGLISALVAAQQPEQVSRLILLYPAFCIPDNMHEGKMMNTRFDPKNLPEHFRISRVPVGECYVEDAAELEPYEACCSYPGPVLIIHGLEDEFVPIDYSRRAAERYPNCKLVEIHGDHGFKKDGYFDCLAALQDALEPEC